MSSQTVESTSEQRFEPRIVAFVCNWCTYTGADLAGTSRLPMAPNVRILRLPCTGRIDTLFILKAFERGADAVIVSGCHPADCHYTSGNYHARRRFAVFSELASFMGIDLRRVVFSWVSASEGQKWAELVNQTTEQVRALGPYDAFAQLVRGEVVARPNLAPVPRRAAVPTDGPSKSGGGGKRKPGTERASAARSERNEG